MNAHMTEPDFITPGKWCWRLGCQRHRASLEGEQTRKYRSMLAMRFVKTRPPVMPAGAFLPRSEKAKAQINAARSEEQGHKQTGAAENGDRFEGVRFGI